MYMEIFIICMEQSWPTIFCMEQRIMGTVTVLIILCSMQKMVRTTVTRFLTTAWKYSVRKHSVRSSVYDARVQHIRGVQQNLLNVRTCLDQKIATYISLLSFDIRIYQR